jgi:phage shock protein C
MEPKRLYRSRTETMLGGVCSGLARYFSMDPTLVRVIFVLLFLLAGHGLLIYLVLWIIVPLEPAA